MNERQLNALIEEIRAERVDDETVKAAAKRVFSGLFDSAFIASEPSGKIRGCADVQALLPAYLNRTLSSARALLVEDHVLQCVDCRRALAEARGSGTNVLAMPSTRARRKPVPSMVWAAAAVLMIGIGLGFTGLLPGQNRVRATVASLEGTLYRVTDLGASLVKVGDIIKNTDELRTAKGSHAILRLAGGAMVEIAERSEVSLSRGWRSTNVNLARGQMIVDARNGGDRQLHVTSGEMTIPVDNALVALNRGSKESRVAVASGFVEVSTGGATRRVEAGRQFGGELRLASLNTADFAWSQNADSYMALLAKELSNLQKAIQALPSPGLRYASQLAPYLPADTFVYGAIPNFSNTIAEAKKLFDSRLAESEVLRQWWQQQAVSKNGQFDDIVNKVSSISSYLGEEIVIAVSGEAAEGHAGPVILAEIKQPGLAEYLQSNIPGDQLQIVKGGAVAGDSRKLLVALDQNILVISPSAAALNRVEEVIQKRASGDFANTPFFARIGQVYGTGAGSFLAANLEQITAKSVGKTKAAVPAGFDNIRYLVLERKESGGDTEMRASVSFDGTRHGIASWLSAPSPAGSLDFVSPDASFAASLVMKNPRVMMQELLGIVGGSNANFTQELEKFQAQAGLNLVDDVAAPLGSDVTFALDGPLLPIPAWKLAMEVYDPKTLQLTLETLIQRFNQQAQPKAGHLTITNEQVNSRTFYAISNDKAPGLAAYYTFVDGYLLASSSKANVQTAIDNKQTRHILTESQSFRDKMPADGYPNFSAMIYSNMGSTLGDLSKQWKSLSAEKQAQQQSIGALLLKGGSGLVFVYGESDRIAATARGSFLGFDLGTLVGIQEGKPLKTMIASAPTGVGKSKGIVN